MGDDRVEPFHGSPKPPDATSGLRRRLEASAGAIRSLVEGLHPEEASWKPDPARWSILEVVNHLADEEREDFRTRLDILLHRPDDPFPAIDPQGWVTSRNYAGRHLAESLERFLDERGRSLRWLASLEAGDLDRETAGPTRAAFTPRQMMASWAAHDLLHVRQITKLRYDYLAREVAPLKVDYAGQW